MSVPGAALRVPGFVAPLVLFIMNMQPPSAQLISFFPHLWYDYADIISDPIVILWIHLHWITTFYFPKVNRCG